MIHCTVHVDDMTQDCVREPKKNLARRRRALFPPRFEIVLPHPAAEGGWDFSDITGNVVQKILLKTRFGEDKNCHILVDGLKLTLV